MFAPFQWTFRPAASYPTWILIFLLREYMKWHGLSNEPHQPTWEFYVADGGPLHFLMCQSHQRSYVALLTAITGPTGNVVQPRGPYGLTGTVGRTCWSERFYVSANGGSNWFVLWNAFAATGGRYCMHFKHAEYAHNCKATLNVTFTWTGQCVS
jgi:hypothetical protein